MLEQLDCDFLIAGAGPTGISAAIALGQAGYRVELIDKHKTGLSFSRAILVNSQTLTILKSYGVADKIAARGRPFKSITIYGPSKTLIQGDITSNSDEAIQPMASPQLDTERCFTEWLYERSFKIQRPYEFTEFIDKTEYVESSLNTPYGERQVKSRYLLGADGSHSIAQKGLSIDYNQSATTIEMYSQHTVMD